MLSSKSFCWYVKANGPCKLVTIEVNGLPLKMFSRYSFPVHETCYLRSMCSDSLQQSRPLQEDNHPGSPEIPRILRKISVPMFPLSCAHALPTSAVAFLSTSPSLPRTFTSLVYSKFELLKIKRESKLQIFVIFGSL
jgi:hypothetical protein